MSKTLFLSLAMALIFTVSGGVAHAKISDGGSCDRYNINIQLMNVTPNSLKTPMSGEQISLTGTYLSGIFNVDFKGLNEGTRSSNARGDGVTSFDFPNMNCPTTYVIAQYGYWNSESLCTKINGPYYCFNLTNNSNFRDFNNQLLSQPVTLDSSAFFAKNADGTPMSTADESMLPLNCALTQLAQPASGDQNHETWEIDCSAK
jgi:hypothetical protein